MKMKKQNKAFTLVELMIVIAIIGVLAATLLPRLQGAQERSRDTGRVASLKSVAAVFEAYFNDEGQYPAAPSAAGGATAIAGCLSTADGSVEDTLAALMKGGNAPLDPVKVNLSSPCGTAGVYGYRTYDNNGIDFNAYILTANVEQNKKANYDVTSNAFPAENSVDISTISLITGGYNDDTSPGERIYVERS